MGIGEGGINIPYLLFYASQFKSVCHWSWNHTVYPKKYAHGFCFAVLCCGYTLTDFPISIRLTSLALWQSNDCPSASKATLMNMDKYFMWIHYEWLHNHNKAKHNKTVCIFLGIYCMYFAYMMAYMATPSPLICMQREMVELVGGICSSSMLYISSHHGSEYEWLTDKIFDIIFFTLWTTRSEIIVM